MKRKTRTPIKFPKDIVTSTPRNSRCVTSNASNVSRPKKTNKNNSARRGNNNQQNLKILKDIKKWQKCTTNLIRKTPFIRVVREIASYFATDLRWQSEALSAIQEATEYYMVYILEKSYKLSQHARRKTLMSNDLKLLKYLCG